MPSGIDIKLALKGYCDALAECDIGDLDEVVKECVTGVPKKYQWAPDAATVRQLCRDKQMQRKNEGRSKTEAPKPTDDDPPSEDEYDRMRVKAEKLVSELVADSDARKPHSWAKFLTGRQPADGDYGWRDRQK
jgi:hypothetical protein